VLGKERATVTAATTASVATAYAGGKQDGQWSTLPWSSGEHDCKSERRMRALAACKGQLKLSVALWPQDDVITARGTLSPA
jgi:hypothetical protein